MNVSRWAVVIIGCLLFFGVGFVAGGFVEAGGIAPGSSGDPLAAKSYVEKAVAEKFSKLQAQADALQTKVTNLQQTVEKLKKETSSNSTAAAENTSQVKPSSGASQAPTKEPSDSGTTQVKPTVSVEEVASDTIPSGKLATVIAPSANVRKGPGTTYPIVSGLLKGKSVSVSIIQNGWVYVDLGGNVKGWINKDLVEIK